MATVLCQRNSDATRKGILTGLIGRQGAVGAFVSGTAIDADGVITGGTSATDGFAGGFVANPFEGNVSYRDWVTFTTPSTIATGATPDPVINQLLTTTRNTLNKGDYTGAEVNVNLATATYEDVALGGSPANGFNTYVIGTDNYLVGISSTTSLGAALDAQPVGTWLGSFVVYEGGVATTTPFELMVDFAGLNINTTVTNTLYSFTGNFGSNDGTIRGNISRQATTPSEGSLTGLIGSEGAVGVFVSDSTALVSYAGGFVAASPAFDGRVTYADWLDSFSPAPASTPTAGTSAFLQPTGSTLSTVGLRTSNNVGSIIPSTLNLSTADGKQSTGWRCRGWYGVLSGLF